MIAAIYGGLIIAFSIATYKWLKETTKDMPRLDPR